VQRIVLLDIFYFFEDGRLLGIPEGNKNEYSKLALTYGLSFVPNLFKFV
jgi:hypothetical protein